MEEEFRGWFQRIIFAIYSRKYNGESNFAIFKEVFDGMYKQE